MEVEQKPEPEAKEVDLDQKAPPQEAADQDAVPSPMKEEVAATATATKKKVTKKVQKVAKLAVQSLEMYYGDRAYRFLFDCVADFFADLLASDLKQLAPGGKKRKIGLAAKWCPTPGSSFDRSTLLCEAIARRLFPRDSTPDYVGLSEEHYSYQLLHRLRRGAGAAAQGPRAPRGVHERPAVVRAALHPRRLGGHEALQGPVQEARRRALRQVPRGRGGGQGQDRGRRAPAPRDRRRGLPRREGRRVGAAVAPHGGRPPQEGLAEQLHRRLRRVRVSGSMSGTPMEVCVALGLLISELSEKPWAGRVITFSHSPEIHMIKGKTLQEKLRFVQRMDWGYNTNFQAVFDRILRTALDAQLPREKMIRTVFVFSDMEFDQASASRWETDYEAICRKFRDAGYGDVVPQIVFWNLRDSRSTPVTSTQPGVAMVSGFSKNFVKLFLENDGVVNPEAVMNAAIAGEEYQKLAVFD
ncbi:hypothetical protein PVAP13_4KG326920 [Panicum virgatum]|uniref:Uncharacterized protein n=1 Tax=Panicum virgatum TaxID=38727 RepID=A0A8T0TUV0_PANVG|nr:hypothetical protein PVAP13_4KG326920 [Panicum virgatum]